MNADVAWHPLFLPFYRWFLVDLVHGPDCQCYISTNVQTLKIPTPRRRKKVDMLIDFLREQTAAFQPVEPRRNSAP